MIHFKLTIESLKIKECPIKTVGYDSIMQYYEPLKCFSSEEFEIGDTYGCGLTAISIDFYDGAEDGKIKEWLKYFTDIIFSDIMCYIDNAYKSIVIYKYIDNKLINTLWIDKVFPVEYSYILNRLVLKTSNSSYYIEKH